MRMSESRKNLRARRTPRFKSCCPKGRREIQGKHMDSRLLAERDARRPGAAAFGTQSSDLGKGHQGSEVREEEHQQRKQQKAFT